MKTKVFCCEVFMSFVHSCQQCAMARTRVVPPRVQRMIFNCNSCLSSPFCVVLCFSTYYYQVPGYQVPGYGTRYSTSSVLLLVPVSRLVFSSVERTRINGYETRVDHFRSLYKSTEDFSSTTTWYQVATRVVLLLLV